MKREHFLLGALVGLVGGVALSAACRFVATSKDKTQPVEARLPLSVVPLGPEQRPPGVPPDAYRREFNGGAYYIIPLASTR
jgi:hypothetical protein